MSNAQDRQQPGGGAPYLPALPPRGTETQEAVRIANRGLQSISDRVAENRIRPNDGRRIMRQYLESFFNEFHLWENFNVDRSLQPWFEILDNYEQRMANAEQEGVRREPQPREPGVRLPRIEELLAGPARYLPNSGARRAALPNEPRREETNPPREARAPREGNSNRGTWRENRRPEEEDAGREARAGPARRSRTVSSDEEEEDNGGPNPRAAKRAKQDPSKFSWAAEAFIKQSILSPRHKEVIATIENYGADLEAAIDSIERSGLNPIFPRKLWKSVLRDQYIDLTEVLPVVSAYHNTDPQRSSSNPFSEALESTTLTKPVPTKAIVDQVTWRRAWQATADAIIFAFATRRRELNQYEQHIQRLFDDNLTSFHRNIIQYDKAVRQLIASRRDILFDEVDHPDVARFKNVYLSPTGSHFLTTTPQSTIPSQPSVRARNRAKEVCRKFNRGECGGCERKHSCSVCGEAGHGAVTCSKANRK